MENGRGTTAAECRLQGWSVVVWCSACNYGRPLNLLAFEAAGNGNVPLERLKPRLRCTRIVKDKPCKGRARTISISRQIVGKVEPVLSI